MRACSARQGTAFTSGLAPNLRLEGIRGLALEMAALVLENPLEYTEIGDTVNTAVRIERLARSTEVSLLLFEEILAAVGVRSRDPNWREVASQTLRGRSQPVRLFSPRIGTDGLSPRCSQVEPID